MISDFLGMRVIVVPVGTVITDPETQWSNTVTVDAVVIHQGTMYLTQAHYDLLLAKAKPRGEK